MAVLRELSMQAVAAVLRSMPQPRLQAGTVSTPGSVAPTVLLDGDSVAVPVQNLAGRRWVASERVMVLMMPPHGAFILGPAGGVDASQRNVAVTAPGGAAVAGFSAESTVNTLVVAAQMFPYRALVSCGHLFNATTATDEMELRVKSGATILQRTRDVVGSALQKSMGMAGAVVDVAAGTGLTLTTTLLRVGGAGTMTTFVDGETNWLTALLVPTTTST